MTVYIDEIRQYPKKWSHMWSDDLDELHAMADRIGLKRSWFQTGNIRFLHYDVVPSKRALALKHGAEFMRLEHWIRHMRKEMDVQLRLFDL